MSFKEVRRKVIDALWDGRFSHEERDQAEGKNLLARGDVSPDDVVMLLNRCRGDQHRTSPHHADATQTVHIFKPTAASGRWYIKCYVVEMDGIEAVFISVHQ
jgi:hypothetical protein